MNKRTHPNTEEITDDSGHVQIQINYDDSGEIGQLFFYNPEIDGMFKADIEAFTSTHPLKFKRFEMIIIAIVKDPDFINARKYGT